MPATDRTYDLHKCFGGRLEEFPRSRRYGQDPSIDLSGNGLATPVGRPG
ncbi:MAG TPA: hypothetical protein VMZ31_07755 [Phycisphaerae bacterium]|nr:hypothetical protein [Phycisphaerae bacterium]